MSYPYLTAEIPGTDGIFKESCEDFEVTEIPLYEPCGSGEHCYALVEKKGLTTLEMLRRLSRATAVPERELGYAGMKDARGITRQTVSIPRIDPDRLLSLEIPGVKILTARLHHNKLRLGHLAGNRFKIKIREVAEGALARAEEVLAILVKRGLPNYFGAQRYGSQGNSAAVGLRLLQNDPEGAVRALIGSPESVQGESWKGAITAFIEDRLAESLEMFPGHCRTEREIIRTLIRRPGEWNRALKTVHPRLLSLYISACQSELFDRLLAGRICGIDRVMTGDIACKHTNGACFRIEDAAAETARVEVFEISATGPMFGRKMLIPLATPGKMEAEVLAAAGLTAELFNSAATNRLEGERRPLRVPLVNPSAWQEQNELLLEFTLPKGSYATSLLREIMKSERPALDCTV